VFHTLAGLGLSLNPDKIKWIANRHSGILKNQALIVCNVKVCKSDAFVALGSVITADLKEGPAYMHRISQSWRCYQKWATVLASNAPLDVRLTFWSRTVLPSLLWGLQTTRAQKLDGAFKKLLSCQKYQVRRMLKCKRRPINEHEMEPWLDYQIRSLRTASAVIERAQINVLTKLQDLKRSWAGHIARFGVGPNKETHPLKAILAWRSLAWWQDQSFYNKLRWSPIKHSAQQGRPRRWEQQFSSNWMLALQE